MIDPSEMEINHGEDRIRNKIVEAIPASQPSLSAFLASNEIAARIEEPLSVDDISALAEIPFETGVIQNQYGTFSWKGNDEEVITPPVVVQDAELFRGMFNSRISLDLHNHPESVSVFSHDRSYPGPIDLTSPRVHNIAVVTKKGVSLTNPLLYVPGRPYEEDLGDLQLQYGSFLKGHPSCYTSKHYDGDDWGRFIEAAGASFQFIPMQDRDAIEKRVLHQTPVENSHRTWMHSANRFERRIALRLFDGEYNYKDYVQKPELFRTLESFAADDDIVVRGNAMKLKTRIEGNIAYTQAQESS